MFSHENAERYHIRKKRAASSHNRTVFSAFPDVERRRI